MYIDRVAAFFQVGCYIQLPGVEGDHTGFLSVDVYFCYRPVPFVQFDGISACKVIEGIFFAIAHIPWVERLLLFFPATQCERFLWCTDAPSLLFGYDREVSDDVDRFYLCKNTHRVDAEFYRIATFFHLSAYRINAERTVQPPFTWKSVHEISVDFYGK